MTKDYDILERMHKQEGWTTDQLHHYEAGWEACAQKYGIKENAEVPNLPRRNLFQLSTGHITAEDDRILQTHAGDNAKHPQCICSYYGGYIVSCWHDEGEIDERLTEIGHSPSYINVVRVAQALGAHFLQLDCDGDGVDWLPVHNWSTGQ